MLRAILTATALLCLSQAAPAQELTAAQRDAFTDGCHTAHNWSVCWEMTANDGINFTDATYNGQLIFSSAKIGQIEAWYPSWPGGYRDEIGFAATVPPFGKRPIPKPQHLASPEDRT